MSDFVLEGGSGSMLDRRGGPRKSWRSRAQLRWPSGAVLDVRTIDISLEGSAVVAERNLAPGTECQLVFSLLLNGQPTPILTAPVKVVFGSLSGAFGGFRLGLTFGQMSRATQDAIQSYSRP
jgi:c-di-GMP-binding flagellar brake protein YcgR